MCFCSDVLSLLHCELLPFRLEDALQRLDGVKQEADKWHVAADTAQAALRTAAAADLAYRTELQRYATANHDGDG